MGSREARAGSLDAPGRWGDTEVVEMNETGIHHDAEALEPFLGRWRGRGRGKYPTITPFEYEEECEYRPFRKPFVIYSQKTWDPRTGEPLHQEVGYLRPKPGGLVEIVIAHPTGIAEILEGSIRNGEIDAESTHVGLTSTAKDVRRLRRQISVEGDSMHYTLLMAAVGLPMQEHLTCSLTRVPE